MPPPDPPSPSLLAALDQLGRKFLHLVPFKFHSRRGDDDQVREDSRRDDDEEEKNLGDVFVFPFSRRDGVIGSSPGGGDVSAESTGSQQSG